MRLERPRIRGSETAFELARYHNDYLTRIITQLNGFSDGRVAQVTNATTAAPTTGNHAQGDFVRNSTPTEQGSASSKYVVYGWICVASGEPGTWVQCRFLTGN